MRLSKYFGPSTLVAAAFIGPGTLTTCTLAGVQSGYTLLWALLFSIVATIVLQEMSARLGFVTQEGLGEAISKQFPQGIGRFFFFFLVIGAILIGNAAYEAGNISGGILGLELTVGKSSLWPLILSCIAGILLWVGKFKWIERFLIGLVVLMAICFLVTVSLVGIDWSAFFNGFVPSYNENHLILILGLIGTTVVPYNLFLHASTISKKYNSDASLRDIRVENTVSIVLGGLISILIVCTAAASRSHVQEVKSAADLAMQLAPVMGNASTWLMGIGLLAAGLSSTLTAPLAAAYAAKGLFGWSSEKTASFRLTWFIILAAGCIVALTGLKPILIIQFAQVTNALLLPIIGAFLLYISNTSSILGKHTNKPLINFLGSAILLICLVISFKSFNSLFGII